MSSTIRPQHRTSWGIHLPQGAGYSEVGALAASIFLSNLPEAAGGAKRMREMGWRDSRVLGLWFGAALLLTAAAVAGNLLFRHAPEEDLALIQAFAGGAVIASLATEIFPKAYPVTTTWRESRPRSASSPRSP